AAALIILFTPILFVFAFLLYRILRPQETVADAQERALAEEAMLVEVERQAHCANCGRAVHADWIICPTCRNRLRRFCPNCSNLVELDWSLCPWCGKDFERPEQLPERVRAGRPSHPATVPAGTVATAQVLAAATAAPPRSIAPSPSAITATAPASPFAPPVAPPVAPAPAPAPAETAPAEVVLATPAPTLPESSAPAAPEPPAPRTVRVRTPRLKPAPADGPASRDPGSRPR
ncbi:MAG TPA: zinc ribbon domain-containing protein, partial [Candidatus Sulfotelmatobacter sp.]|nr:zinc ribbon domain-containing protein [Candidatus Sulfotelmatobacter sp.]